jgi:hypothetical protein
MDVALSLLLFAGQAGKQGLGIRPEVRGSNAGQLLPRPPSVMTSRLPRGQNKDRRFIRLSLDHMSRIPGHVVYS